MTLKKKAETLRKSEAEGFDKGFAAGIEQGIRAGQKEIVERLSRLDSVISELEHVKERKIQEILPEIVDLSLEIARKIVHRKIEQDREIIVSGCSRGSEKNRQGREDAYQGEPGRLRYDDIESRSAQGRVETQGHHHRAFGIGLAGGLLYRDPDGGSGCENRRADQGTARCNHHST